MRYTQKQLQHVKRKRTKRVAESRRDITNYFLAMITGKNVASEEYHKAYVDMKDEWCLH